MSSMEIFLRDPNPSFGEKQGKFQSAWSTSSTKDSTQHLLSTILRAKPLGYYWGECIVEATTDARNSACTVIIIIVIRIFFKISDVTH